MKLQFAVLICCSLDVVQSITVLLFLIGSKPAERGTFEFLAQKLAVRNHRTITVKPILIPEYPRLVKPKLYLVHEKSLKNLLPRKLYEPLEHIGDDVPWRNTYEIDAHLLPYYAAHNHSCSKVISFRTLQPYITAMLKSDLLTNLRKENIDVALIYSGNPCQLAIVHILGIPFIYFDLEGFSDETRVASGTPIDLNIKSSQCSCENAYNQQLCNVLCIANEYLTQSSLKSLARIFSKRYQLLDEPITQLFANHQAEYGRKHIEFPDVNQIKQQAELYFINTDLMLEYDYALPSNVIPVGGLHIDDVKLLLSPWNDTSLAGNIVLSFGTQANAAKMQRHQATAILDALKRFEAYQIYCMVGSELKLGHYDEHDMPAHIKLMAYVPQNDLLANKRTRLLITNGGIHSIIEALANGVPIVGIPLYGSNKHNLDKVSHKKFGIVVEKMHLTAETFHSAIQEVLTNTRYTDAVQAVARLWKMRPTKPLQVALSWVEYVGRNRGARFLKQPTSNSKLRIICETRYLRLATFTLLFLLTSTFIAYIFVHAHSERKVKPSPKSE